MPIYGSFDALWSRLPQPSDIGTVLPTWPADWEPCCACMSHALNMSGLPVTVPNPRRNFLYQGRSHYLAVGEMRDYLTRTYGAGDNYRLPAGNRIAIIAQIDNRKGIIVFGHRHIDLWNGSRIHGEGFILSALWEAPSALSEGIFFWEVLRQPAATTTTP